MGGLAAVVDWERPVHEHRLDPMLAMIPHRVAGGIGTVSFDHAALIGYSCLDSVDIITDIYTVGYSSLMAVFHHQVLVEERVGMTARCCR